MPFARARLLRLAAVLPPLLAYGWWRGRSGLLPAPESPPAPPARRLSLMPLALALAVSALLLGGAMGWRQHQQSSQAEAVARAMTGGEPRRAPQLIIRYGCSGCHTIPGVPGADGRVAPPLAELRQRVYLGGVLPNSAENLTGWIVNPRRYSPNTAMPASGISQAEARDVAAYLYSR
jgi:cytochrome c